MKPRDLLPVIEYVRRSTTNRDVLTICDALFKRVQHEIATQPSKPTTVRFSSAVDPASFNPSGAIGSMTMPRTAMDAVVAEAEGGRKPARGKAKRALAKVAARKAARNGKGRS